MGIYGIPQPPRPLTPYMRFFFERNCEEKSKGSKDMINLSRNLSEEWKTLSDKKKEYYQKTYEIRSREREELQEEYELLTKKKKPVSGYLKYYKMRYREVSKDHPKLDIKEVGRMVTNDWKNLTETQKNRFNQEAAEEHKRSELTQEEREKKIEEYNDRVKRFQE